MAISMYTVVIWVMIPLCNLVFWYYRGIISDVHVHCPSQHHPSRRAIPADAALHASKLGNLQEGSSQVAAVECDEEVEERKKSSNTHKRKLPRYRPRFTGCAKLDSHPGTHMDPNYLNSMGNSNSNSNSNSDSNTDSHANPILSTISSTLLDEWRSERMASMTFGGDTSIIVHSTQPSSDSSSSSSSRSSWNVGEGGKHGEGEGHGQGDDSIPSPSETSTTITSSTSSCKSLDVQWIGSEDYRCMAIVKIKNIAKHRAYAIQRFDQSVDENNLGEKDRPEAHHKLHQPFVGNTFNEGHHRPIGFFRKIPAERGFQRTRDKLGTFVKNYQGYSGIAAQLNRKLQNHYITSGMDVTMMVVNEGEIDLWLNFACSCQQNGISMRHVFVFAASEEIIPLIESTGAMGLYHVGYASVSKKASNDYLDRVFVDMMWYKAFSVHLLVSRGINVLFQDVDLVWFRNPMTYFNEYIANALEKSQRTGSHPEAFFSDDGQRSLRYSPFFANSGFYYLKSTPRSTYFSWSIMITFDAVQVLGSHQNVFTMKLVEGLALSAQHTVILPIYQFPTGIIYHHDRKYMRRLKKKEEHPYGFHMCWTQGKPEKLKYLRKSGMWYLTETCSSLDTLIQGGKVYSIVTKGKKNMRGGQPTHGAADTGAYGGGMGGITHELSISDDITQWAYNVDNTCCMSMEGGPGLNR